MGGVVIAANIKSTKVRIDENGNEIDPKTKEIIKYKETDYVPSAEELAAKANIPVAPAPVPEIAKGPNNALANMIQKKVEEAVNASLANINIGKMVEDAINNAFK